VSLITEIIDGAASDASVPTVLRKLKIVAFRTGSVKLADWVTKELDGYASGDPIPTYRGPIGTIVLGHFTGIGGREAQNVPLPPSTFPEEIRESQLFMLNLHDSVASIEEMANKDHINMAWPSDAMRYYNSGVRSGTITRILVDDMMLASAHRPIMRHVFVGVLDAVRNRALDLALELEEVSAEVGQPDASAETRERAAGVANTFNFYGNSNVAVDSSHFEQSMTVQRGDLGSLTHALREIGVSDVAIADLRNAIAADADESGGAPRLAPGSRVKMWLAQATTQFGTGAAADLVAEAVKAYFGG
jgi:hypothetical protein